MAGAGKKTFTAGEVLTASDVNTYLMEQSVMYFGGTAARSSAIPTPSTGMTTYIGTTGTASIPQIETYTGSAWQTPYGLTQVANVSVSATTSFFVNNVFSSAFDNYLIIWRLAAAGGSALQMRLSVGGTELIGTGYNWQRLSATGTTVAGAAAASSAQWDIGAVRPTTPIPNFGTLTISNPFNAAITTYNHMTLDQLAAASIEINAGYNTSTSSYDGFRWFTSTNMTGTIKIYGYRNS